MEAPYLCVIEDAAAVVRANNCVLPVLAKVCSGDEPRLAIYFVPQRHLLVRNVPQPELPVQGAAQKVSVVLESGNSREFDCELSNRQ